MAAVRFQARRANELRHFDMSPSEQAYRLGAKPVTAEIVEQVLSRAIDDVEPTLTRNGYDAAALVTQLNARPSDVRAFLGGTLDPEHQLQSRFIC